MGLLNLDNETIGTEEITDAFAQAQELLMRVAQYSQPVREIQMVCDHPNQIISLQKQITDLQTQRFLPPSCDHTGYKTQIQDLQNNLEEA
jgi:hypothetical protein